MKKLTCFVVGLLILGGFAAIGIGEAGDLQETKETISISDIIIEEKEQYLTVSVEEATSLITETGKPVLPVVTKSYTFPFGTKIEDVVVTFSDIETQTLTKKIEPAPEPVALLPSVASFEKTTEVVQDEEVYSSAELYPAEKYVIRKGVGLKDNEHVVYLNVHTYPVQYSPAEDTLYTANSVDIEVIYNPPENPLIFNDVYDLLIIAPEEFSSKLQRLVTHKESIGVSTKLETVENIYANPAYDGRDEPEDIKLFIKDAIDPEGLNWGVDYVLLVGGRYKQTRNWWVPDRETNNDDGWEPGYSSDLYYADIWKEEGGEMVFEDWDSNGNDIFAEFKGLKKDVMDFYPDVYVGRITCNYGSDVDTVVDKIITYESGPAGDWFDKAYVIAGDTFAPPAQNALPNYPEGEMETAITATWLQSAGFDVEKLWTSLGTFTDQQDVIDAITSGAGFVHFAGHGNPTIWSTHPLNDATVWITGLENENMLKLKNGDKLPVLIVGGCHNAQFNTTLANIPYMWKEAIKKNIEEYGIIQGIIKGTQYYWNVKHYYYEWAARCWASWLLLSGRGGSIASIGNTGLGYGYINQYATEGLGGWIEPRFFDAYVNQSKAILGEAHGTAISDYITYIDYVNSDQIDRKTIEEWALIGDPSLKIGGT